MVQEVDDEDALLQKYLESDHLCPQCNTAVDIIGHHERDASNDEHICPQCGWRAGQLDVWDADNKARARRVTESENKGGA